MTWWICLIAAWLLIDVAIVIWMWRVTRAAQRQRNTEAREIVNRLNFTLHDQ